MEEIIDITNDLKYLILETLDTYGNIKLWSFLEESYDSIHLGIKINLPETIHSESNKLKYIEINKVKDEFLKSKYNLQFEIEELHEKNYNLIIFSFPKL